MLLVSLKEFSPPNGYFDTSGVTRTRDMETSMSKSNLTCDMETSMQVNPLEKNTSRQCE